MDKLSAWVAVIIIGREFTISILRAVAYPEGRVIALVGGESQDYISNYRYYTSFNK